MYSIQFADLKAFIQFITGSPVPVGTIVRFIDHEETEAIVANACGRQLTLSTLIKEVSMLALLAIVSSRQYTMP